MRGVWKVVATWIVLTAAALSLAVAPRVDGNVLYVNEIPVVTIRSGPASARLQRAASVLLAHDGKANAEAAKVGRRAARVLVGKRAVLEVSARDAETNQTTALALAQSWARNLNRALALPEVKLSATEIAIRSGAAERIWLTGSKAGAAKVSSADPNIVRVTRSIGQLNLQAVGAGSTNVVIDSGEKQWTVAVRVLPIAATFPQQFSATVTGMPATPATVRGAATQAIWTQLKALEGADLKFTVPEIGTIPPGQARTVTVPVRVSAPNAASAEGNVTVTVRNQPLVVSPESELWYCNYPEPLTKFEQVFGANLREGSPARMLYHHINEMGRGLLYHAQILNTSNVPAQVLIIPGDSPTDKNPVFAGIEAAEMFLRNWIQSSGEVVTIPPGQSLPLAFRRLAPKETVSGLVYLALLPGGPQNVVVRADAKPTFTAEGRWTAALNDHAPWRVLGAMTPTESDLQTNAWSEYIYPEPFRTIDVSYQVGGRHGFVRIGQKPIPRADGGKALDGNFGVVYTINARVENPTSQATDIEVVFEASAGYSGALFVLNGQVMRTPLLQPKDERRILRMRLDAGQTRMFTLQTIPLSGGSYPATLAIRPVDTLIASGRDR